MITWAQPRQPFLVGQKAVFKGTHSEAVAGRAIVLWFYPDGKPAQSLSAPGSITGANTYEIPIERSVTTGLAPGAYVGEIWFSDIDDPVAMGPFRFAASGRQS